MPKPKTEQEQKEYYELVAEDNGHTSILDLAASLNMKSPYLVNYVTMYAVQHGLPIPPFNFNRTVQGPMVKPSIYRTNSSRQLQVSQIQLKLSGLGDCLRFKYIGDPDKGIIVIVNGENDAESVREVFETMYGPESDGDGQRAGEIRNLRLPIPDRVESKRRKTS